MTALALRGLAAAALFATAACAGGMTGDTYSSELSRLTEDCRARGGILSPNDLTAGSSAQMSGSPERDYVCKITGEPSNRNR